MIAAVIAAVVLLGRGTRGGDDLEEREMTKTTRVQLLGFALFLMILLPACRAGGRQDGAPAPAPSGQGDGERSAVTPVAGPSWLAHLGLAVLETRLGHLGGAGPQPGARGEEPELAARLEGRARGMQSALRRALSAFGRSGDRADLLDERFRLTGADLYRLDCRSCHGPAGEGAPPEIASLLGPVRASSAAATLKRMEARGTPIDEEMAKELASQAEADVRKRLRQGGEKMPSFEHLRGDEVEALFGYLQELADVDAGKREDLPVTQSVARVGEHLVKGTCHICHDATGPGGHHATMMGGVIPSLASFPEEYSPDSVLYKVERGTSGMMGMMGMMRRRDEMPAFPYLSQEEVAAAYLYLRSYPPRP